MKEKIVDLLKLVVFLSVMGMGFFTIYALVWVGLGIPTGWWAGLTVTVLTIASEYGFITWLGD